MKVVGVVSQWDSRSPYDEGYRILPSRGENLQRIQTTPTAAPLAKHPLSLPKAGDRAVGLFVPLTNLVLVSGLVLKSIREGKA